MIHGASPDAACPGQGYTGSHWTPPLGDYSLRIASAAARATANKTTMYYVPTLMAILMVIAMRRYYTTRIAQLRRSRAFIKVTLNTAIGRTLAPIASIRHVNAGCFFSFIVKRARVDMLAPNNNRGVTYQTDEKHLNNMVEYFVGVVNVVFNRYNNRFL